MTAWQAPPLPPRLLASRQVPLVGRRSELETFEQLWAAVEAGNRQAVFVGGEPGAGKTRLVAEVAGILAEHDVLVLVGTSTIDAGVPYQPFAQMLEALVSVNGPDNLARLIPDDARELSRLSPSVGIEPPDGHESATTGERRDLFDAVTRLLGALTADRPVLLVLDDLHWAQIPTLALLHHIVHECADVPVMALATFRTTAPDRSDELTAQLAELHRLDGIRRLDLAGLDTDAIAEYLSLEGGISRRAARPSAALLRDHTGGNPFFLRELWTDLERRGGLSALHSDLRVPASIGDTLERRLAGLGSEVRDIIELAAVLGDTFELGSVVGASEAPDRQSMHAIDSATAVGLIEPVEGRDNTFSFVHSLTRQAVVDSLPPSRLMLINARVAEALEAQGEVPSLLPRLAHHYLTSHILGNGDKAIHYGTEAARQAERSLAFEEAAAWFERVASLPELDMERQADCLFGAAANHLRGGDFARARVIYDRLTTMPDPMVRLHAAMGYEDANWRPGLGDARPADLLASAIQDCRFDPDDPLYIRALGSLGRALAFAGETERAREVGSRAIELARHHGDAPLLAHTLKTSLWHGLTPDVAELQLDRSTELSNIAKELGDFETLGAAAYFRAMVAYLRGRPRDLNEAMKDQHRAVEANGQAFFMYVAGCVSQGLAFARGDFQEAERWAESTLRLSDSFGVDTTEGSHGVQMFMLHRETGGLGRFRRFITGEEPFTGRWLPGLLALYTELGVRTGVERTLRPLLARDLSAHTTEAAWPMDLVFMTEAVLAIEDRVGAERLLPFMTAYAGTNLVAGQFVAAFGSADRYLARLFALIGDDESARGHFRAAEEMDRRMGSVAHLAETLAHHALFLQARGRSEEAASHRATARGLAETNGQQRVIDMLDAEGPHRRSDGLSVREVEVLRLLAAGLSNREIGERLYISANTAANHVRSILLKTGAANRTQAAMYAADRELA